MEQEEMDKIVCAEETLHATACAIMENEWNQFSDVRTLARNGFARARKYEPGLQPGDYAARLKDWLGRMMVPGTNSRIKLAAITARIDKWAEEAATDHTKSLEPAMPVIDALVSSGTVCRDAATGRYIWKGTPSLYGFMVDIVTYAMGLRDPGDKLPWRKFSSLFVGVAGKTTETAKKAVSNYRGCKSDLPGGHRAVTDALARCGHKDGVDAFMDDLHSKWATGA